MDNPYHVLDLLARALVLVENEYVDPVDRVRLLEGSLKGMIGELDPHSSFLPPQDFTIFRGDTEGRFGGIGVEVDFSGEDVVVIAPIEGSPADRAGILPGDLIVAIDGKSVRGQAPMDLVRVMRGKPGSQVRLTVRRPNETKLRNFTLTREIINVASISTKLLERGVGYVRIKSFQQGTHTELMEHVGRLRTTAGAPLSGIVLDLRNNPGGLVVEALAVADEFMTGGVIFTTRHRGTIVREARARRTGALRRGPLVVLINEYSASAAELVAGALQDSHRATLVGTRTFGKGSVQTIIDLPDGAGLKLTTARYYTPAGRAIQARGVEPDVLVEAAYVRDESFGVLRESDLENHLPAEAGGAPEEDDSTPAPNGSTTPAPGQPPGPDVAPASTPSDGAEPSGDGAEPSGDGAEPTTHLGVAREIPVDPTGGDDFALSIAYQIVTGVLRRRPHD